jgi:phosphoglycerate dehydrogenase-like enzyme
MTASQPSLISGPGRGPGGVPQAIAVSPILSARVRASDLDRIREAAPGARIVNLSVEGLADGPVDDVEVVLRGFLSSEAFDRLLARAPNLRWVHSATSGVERALTPAALSRNIVVTNARGVFTRPIAEHVLLMILAISRRLPQLLELQRERTWQPLEGRELRDLTIGIVGYGSLGRAIASLATAFGARVLVMRRNPAGAAAAPRQGRVATAGEVALASATEPGPRRAGDAALGSAAEPGQATAGDAALGSAAEPGPATAGATPAEALDDAFDVEPRVARVFGPEGLHDLLRAADVVVLAAPLTAETDGLIDDEAIEAMRHDAWLINVARGRLVDDHALIRGLRDGRIGGAALDTFRDEPLPQSSPLWTLPNVIVTPHTSWSSARVLDRSVELFCDNLRRYRAGEPLRNVVDRVAGY